MQCIVSAISIYCISYEGRHTQSICGGQRRCHDLMHRSWPNRIRSTSLGLQRAQSVGERRRSGRPQLPASSSALKTEVLIKTRSQCLSDWRHARRHQGRSRPPLPSAASGRPLRWRAPSGTYVAPSHGSVRSRRLRRARRRYCGVLRRIAAFIAYCNKPPGSRRLRRARRRRRWRGHAGCSGPAPSAQPREIIIIIIINKDKNSSSSSSSNNNNNERSAVTAVRFIPGGDLKSWICRPRAGPRPQRSSGRVPPARRRLQAPLIAAYCGLLCLVAACCGPAPAPGSPTPPPPPSPAWRSFRPLYPAHCGLLRPVAACCGLLRLIAAFCGSSRCPKSRAELRLIGLGEPGCASWRLIISISRNKLQ